MSFWDSSALLPLAVVEPSSERVAEVYLSQPRQVIWWGTMVEIESALARRRRDGSLEDSDISRARREWRDLHAAAHEIAPSGDIRPLALRLLSEHPLRAADALQLAAALFACGSKPQGDGFVCLDERLRAAARREGFTVLPDLR